MARKVLQRSQLKEAPRPSGSAPLTEHDLAIRELAKAHEAHTRSAKHRSNKVAAPTTPLSSIRELQRSDHLQKSRAVLILAIALPLVIVVFLTLILAQDRQARELRTAFFEQQQQVDDLRIQRDFYQQGFQTASEDAARLSRLYGGQNRFTTQTQRFRANTINVTYARFNLTTWSRYELRTKWEDFVEKGLVNVSCLPPPIMIDGGTNETFLLARVDGAMALYVDGIRLAPITNGMIATDVALPSGRHEIALVALNASSVKELYLETTPVDISKLVSDYGTGRGFFDCVNTSVSPALRDQGAIRILFEKK